MSVFRIGFSALIIAVTSAVFAISFSAIIYGGELSSYLDRGIALTLLGAVVVALIGAFSLSYRGSILAPQDLPAILISTSVVSIATVNGLEGEVLFATIVALAAISSVITGILLALVGQMRLAFLSRFVPYPVLAGFLVATGLFLFIGGIDVAMNGAEIEDISDYFKTEIILKWLPIILFSIGIIVATRYFNHSLVLPLALLITCLGFYSLYLSLGLSHLDVQAQNLLLGPFEQGGFLSKINPSILNVVDWGVILAQAPLILSVAASTILGTTLNASGLELSFKRDFDLNQEAKSAGFANILAGFLGGIPSYHLLGQSLLAHRLGMFGAMAGISSAIGCGVVLIFGADMLSVLPVGFFGMVIAFLGLDLIYTWLWEERRHFGLFDFGIVLLIPIIALLFGFLNAIGAGLLVACAYFVYSYAKLDVIRFKTDLSTRRSLVERPDTELAILRERGKQAKVIELSGFLFFGSCNILRDIIRKELKTEDAKTRWIIIDFKHVSGVDISASQILQRIASDCFKASARLIYSDPQNSFKADLQREFLSVIFAPNLTEAIEVIEDELLSEVEGAFDKDHSIAQKIQALFKDNDLDAMITELKVEKETPLIETDGQSQDIYVLKSGQAKVVAARPDSKKMIVAYIRAGSVVGEMAYYSGRPRTASVIAQTPCSVLKISAQTLEILETKYPEVAASFHRLIAQNLAGRLSRTNDLLRNIGL